MYNIIAQKESKLNLQMAADQRRLAHAGKRDSTQMKTISLLGAIFLPATLLASVFSMVFFQVDNGTFFFCLLVAVPPPSLSPWQKMSWLLIPPPQKKKTMAKMGGA